jgi:ATP-dependent DNA helicase DinG
MTRLIDKHLGLGGTVSRAMPGFSVRPQQLMVSHAVNDAMRHRNGIALIEAGTGVGKTLAYLIPAMERARPDRKIVISTHTLALQSQLAERDVPLVQSLWKTPPTAAVVKGRGNYLCLQDYEAAQGDIWNVGDAQFTQIGRWGKSSETGDVSELDFTYPGWMDIRANADTCKGQECRFFDRCFYYKMRRAAQDASLLLVNHALFFSDLVVRQSGEPDAKLLPDYEFVIFDEAHHLETAAAAAFGIAFSSARLPILMEKVRRVARSLDVNKDRLRAIETASEGLFAPFGQSPRPEFFVEEVLGGSDALNDARVHVSAIGMLLDGIATDLLKQDSGGIPALKDRIDGLRRQCVRAKEDLTLLFLGENANFVRWGAQTRSARRGIQVTLNWTPISVAPILAQALWKDPRAVGAALISATLSTDGGFGYYRERLGVPKADPLVTETIVGSPFDYPHHCLLYIPRHLPPPSEDPGYAYQTCEEMIQLIELSQGGAFLLFTSHRALNNAYDRLTQSDLPYPLLRQGEMPNARLIETFKAEQNAVLFGTQSFWEGVDVPGGALRLVIIDRIPFAVPDSPLHKARVDEITRAGGDWFGDFALPQAQLKLKQGFGRLIRTAEDRGVVAILDTRLIRKSYGERIQRFLPPARRASTLDEVRDFFAESAALSSQPDVPGRS